MRIYRHVQIPAHHRHRLIDGPAFVVRRIQRLSVILRQGRSRQQRPPDLRLHAKGLALFVERIRHKALLCRRRKHKRFPGKRHPAILHLALRILPQTIQKLADCLAEPLHHRRGKSSGILHATHHQIDGLVHDVRIHIARRHARRIQARAEAKTALRLIRRALARGCAQFGQHIRALRCRRLAAIAGAGARCYVQQCAAAGFSDCLPARCLARCGPACWRWRCGC